MIRVLVVEDEPVAADAHVAYVQRVEGFEVVGQAHTAQQAMRILAKTPVDLVLLDMNLPDMHGLDVCRAMRAGRHKADVIAVTSARELGVVRAAVSLGIVQYLLKPFVFSSLQDKLVRYAAYREQLHEETSVSGQHEVDRMLASLRGAQSTTLPKGMSLESLDAVTGVVRRSSKPLSASEVATMTGTSRVTARRYLEYLADGGMAERRNRYGTGRPELEYIWHG